MPNLITPKGRVNYAFIHHPEVDAETGKKTYRLLLHWPDPATDLSKLKQAIVAAAQEKWPGVDPRQLELPLRPAAEINGVSPDTGYAANFKRDRGVPAVVKPSVDAAGRRCVVPLDVNTESVYSGCWASVSYSAYTWTYKSRKGVSLSLIDVCKLADDEPLGGSIGRPDEDFDGLEFDMSDDPFAAGAADDPFGSVAAPGGGDFF